MTPTAELAAALRGLSKDLLLDHITDNAADLIELQAAENERLKAWQARACDLINETIRDYAVYDVADRLKKLLAEAGQ